MPSPFDLFTTDAQRSAADNQIKGLTTGYLGSQDLINGGKADLTNNFAKALTPFQTVFNQATTGTGQQGYQAWADAAGANGPEGLARAKTNFTATPGLTEGLNMALDQNDRRAAARGTLGSGGTIADTTRLSDDYNSQKYGNYVAGLQPFSAVPGQATSAASGIAGVNTGLGTALNADNMQLANLFNSAAIGKGNADASVDLAGLTASKNMMSAGMDAAKLAASIFSDERLKDDIEKVGALYDGQPIYRYTYKGDPDRTHIGLIAQEVEALAPDAVNEFGGFKMVDYAKATDFAAAFREAA